MDLLRHHGLELPIFPEEEVISPDDVINLPHDQTEFTRTLVVHTLGFAYSSLQECLNRADEELESYTSVCGASAVEHTRGLVRTDNPAKGPGSELLPRGYRLAARVTIIDKAERTLESLSADMISIENGFWVYRDGSIPNPKPEWLYDIGIRQFMYGKPRGETDKEPANWFLDVEPRFRIRNVYPR